ncbi:MAG TPA: electron transfer flavoprotein subunit alpha/FixB family protein, partial [Hyphomicrobium sp.]|nr:electron transfer flavoprotein subunit alpha/FixB family protein [Hyphomicrobium sp.]
MSCVVRINPRRPYRIGPQGLRRIVLGESGTGDAAEQAQDHATMQKPLRTSIPAVRWNMAIAHSLKGRLDDHAREAIAAAAILASADTGVVALILGAFHEDATALGADRIIVASDFDASRYEPAREEAAIQELVRQYAPEHIFMPDNWLGDGDLGRRLIAKQTTTAAARVTEIDAKHIAVAWSDGATLAVAPLPRFVLLQPGAVDSNLPFVGAGELQPKQKFADVAEVCRDLGLEPTEAGAIALGEAD